MEEKRELGDLRAALGLDDPDLLKSKPTAEEVVPPPRRVVRVLASELDEELRETLHGFVREAIGNEVWLETLLPENPLDGELLKTAIDHHWDLGMLVLDNIRYPSNDRSPAAIISGATKLIRCLRQTSKNPLVCFYTWTDDPELSKRAMAAGADGVFRFPCKAADVVPTLKRCLTAFAPKPPQLPPPLPQSQVDAAASQPLEEDQDDSPPVKPPPVPKQPVPKPPASAPPQPKTPPRRTRSDDSGPAKPLVKPPWIVDLD